MKRFLFSILLSFYCFSVDASHLLGGAITWDCTSNGDYIFYMEVYRDCSGIDWNFQDETLGISGTPLPIGRTGVLLQPDSTRWLASNQGMINYDCDGDSSQFTVSCSNGDQGSVQVFYYKSGLVNLQGSPPSLGWEIYWRAPCCRSSNFVNLGNSGSTVLRAKIFSNPNSSLAECLNSSPKFSEKLPSFLCLNKLSNYQGGGYDVNSDLKLIHSWDRAYSGYFNGTPNYAQYNQGYNFNNPTPDNNKGSNNLASILDSNSGFVQLKISSGFPSNAYLNIIRTDAYKDGKLISSVFREFPIYLFNCNALFPNNTSDSIGVFLNNQNINDLTFERVSGDIVNVNIKAIHQDSTVNSKTITVYPSGKLFSNTFTNSQDCPDSTESPCAILNNLSPILNPAVYPYPYYMKQVNKVESNFAWQTDCSHLDEDGNERTHLFNFTVKNDACPTPDWGSATIKVKVKPPFTMKEPIVSCIGKVSDSIDISWYLPDTLRNFKKWLIYGKPYNSNQYVVVDSVLNAQKTNYTAQENSLSNYELFKVSLVFQLCNLEYERISEPKGRLIDLSITFNDSIASLNWGGLAFENIDTLMSYYIFANIDDTGYSIIDTTSPGASSYLYKSSACSFKANFFIRRTDCIATSDTAQYLYNPINSLVAQYQDNGCINLKWRYNYLKPTETSYKTSYIYASFDNSSFVLYDSVFNKNSYCFVDSFCYVQPSFRVVECGRSTNDFRLTPVLNTIELELEEEVNCTKLKWNLKARESYANTVMSYDIERSTDDFIFETIGFTSKEEYCIVEPNCEDTTIYRIKTSNCPIYSERLRFDGKEVEINDSIYKRGGSLYSVYTDGDVYWYDCIGDTIISDSSSLVFSPSVTGQYAAIFREFHCQDTSECITVSQEDFLERDFKELISLVQNPVSGRVKLLFEEQFEQLDIEVYNSNGQIVDWFQIFGYLDFEFRISGNNGIYFLLVSDTKGNKTGIKVIKQ